MHKTDRRMRHFSRNQTRGVVALLEKNSTASEARKEMAEHQRNYHSDLKEKRDDS